MATILVVDDILVNRAFLITLLRPRGHRLLEAADGREGLAVARAEHPDLVITDVLMPVMDGYEFVRHLRLDPATGGIPVVFYTAHYGEREARALALSSGVAFVLTKPVEPEDALAIVERALAGETETGVPLDTLLPTAEFDREHLQLLTDKLSEKTGDLRSVNARLRALVNIGLELASERDAERLLESVCVAARELFGATYVTLGILDSSDGRVERVVTSGVDTAGWLTAGDAVAGLLATVIGERRTLRGQTDGDPSRRRLRLPADVRAFLAAPVASPTHVYGWICLVGNDGRAFIEDDEALVTALAGQVGRIYENDHLYAMARKRADELEHEIRERKLAEETLHESGALQRAIFSSVNFSSIATDAQGVIQIFNVGAERMLGYTAAEVMNTIPATALHDPQGLIERATALSLEFGTPIAPGFDALIFKASRGIEDIYELTKIRKDGSRFPAMVSITALRDTQDGIIGYLLIATDNTARMQVDEERKRADEARRISDERFRALVRASSDLVYRMSPDWSEMRQLDGQDFIANTQDTNANWFEEYIHPDDQAHVRAAIDEAIRAKSNFELEHRVRRVDGSFGWTFSRAIPLSNAKGEIVEWFGAATDVTKRKRLEHTLQQKNIELENASRMKSEFLANMSHELRTPLNAIIGFSEVLRDGLIGEITDRQRAFTSDIFSSGTHLLSLINDILDLSKVEAGKMTLDLDPVSLAAVFVNGLSVIKEKAASRHIRLALDIAEPLGSMQADARKLKQIVYNLLANAVKFTADDGQVTLHATRVPRADVGRLRTGWTGRNLSLVDNEFREFLEIRVTDTGIGISAEGMERLFKPFSQIDSGLARRFEGTGLGLVLVKLLADLHGGAVAVESAPGEGSCFTVWLPFRPLPEQIPMPATA